MRNVLLVDMEKCTGCGACVTACSFAKEKMFDPTKTRIRIYKDESRCLGVPIVCEHCEEPPCVDACPTAAISKDPETGIVRIDLDICNGCRECEEACPYAAVIMDPERNIAVICDLCGGDPACVKVCTPARAIQYVEADQATIDKKMRLAEERVKALKSFISGGA